MRPNLLPSLRPRRGISERSRGRAEWPSLSSPLAPPLHLERALGRIRRIHHHDLEQVFEPAGEQLHELVPQLRPRPARARFEGRDVVLRFAQPAGELPLGQACLFALCLEPDGADLDADGLCVFLDDASSIILPGLFVNAKK